MGGTAGVAPGGARALRADLMTTAADPRPQGSGALERAAAVAVAALLLAFFVSFRANTYSGDHTLGVLGLPLFAAQAMAVLLALYRSVPAWWLATVAQLLVATFQWTAQDPDFARTSAELAVQSWLLFQLARRRRPPTAVVALLGGTVVGLAHVIAVGTPEQGILAVAVPGVTALVGVLLRARAETRSELVAQRELAAAERVRRAQLEERQRIARELHDVVAHHMSVISIQAQVAPHLVEDPPEELRENLAGIRADAVEALTELRRILGVLRSGGPGGEGQGGVGREGDEGVPHAPQPTLARLDELADKVRSAGLPLTTRVAGEPRVLPPAVELSAYRIVQEALSNVLRHAPGARAHVEVAYERAAVTVRISNTPPGAGPSPGARHGSGHGLLGMRERAAMLGGTISCGHQPDGGYAVTATLPSEGVPEPSHPPRLPHPPEPREPPAPPTTASAHSAEDAT